MNTELTAPSREASMKPFAYAHFHYSLNTTFCDDMTTCPSAGNTTCCDAGQGIHEIIFQQQQEIPTNAAALPSHYAAEGYSLLTASTTTSASDTPSNTSASSTKLVPKASSSSLTSSTSAATSSTPAASAKGSDKGEQLSNRSQIVLATVVPALALLVGAGTWWETARRNRTRKAAATAAIPTRSRARPRSWPL